MDRVKKMMKHRMAKQDKVEETEPGVILIFAEDTAAIKGRWHRGSEGEPPVKYGALPEWYARG